MAPALGCFGGPFDVPVALPGPEELEAPPSPVAAAGPSHGTRSKKARLQEAQPDFFKRLAILEAEVAQQAVELAGLRAELTSSRKAEAALRKQVAELDKGGPRAASGAATAAQASAAAAVATAKRALEMAQLTDSHRQADHNQFSAATRHNSEGLEQLKQQGLKANVIIHGVAEGAAVEPVIGATKAVALERIGVPPAPGAPPRPVRARFACVADKHRVLKARSKEMRAQNITFRDDLTPLQRAAKQKLVSYHPALKEKGLTPYWRGARLFFYSAGNVLREYQPGMPDDPLLAARGAAGGRGGPGGRGRAGGPCAPSARGGILVL